MSLSDDEMFALLKTETSKPGVKEMMKVYGHWQRLENVIADNYAATVVIDVSTTSNSPSQKAR